MVCKLIDIMLSSISQHKPATNILDGASLKKFVLPIIDKLFICRNLAQLLED